MQPSANLGDPFHPIIASKNASFFITFEPIGYRAEKGPDNGQSLYAIRGQEEGAGNPNGWPVINGSPLENPGKSATNLGDPLSSPY